MQETNIDQLAPVIPPETVSFWPPQPGWYVLFGLLLFVLCYALYRYIIHRKKNRYRSIALREVQSLPVQKPDISELILLNRILKATALQGFPRSTVAALYGEEWLHFLDSTAVGSNFKEAGDLLVNSSYHKAETLEIESQQWANLLVISKYWIKKHKIIS